MATPIISGRPSPTDSKMERFINGRSAMKSPVEPSIGSFEKESNFSKDRTYFSQWLETKNTFHQENIDKLDSGKLDASKSNSDFKINLK